jgi:hypothetical protein
MGIIAAPLKCHAPGRPVPKKELVVWGILLLLALLVVPGCFWYGPRQVAGIDVEADLIVYFDQGASDEEISYFWRNVLGTSEPGSTAFQLHPAISGVAATRSVEGHQAVTVDFWPDANKEERQEVIERVTTSPIVFKVLKNAVPSQVTTLE